MEPVWEKAKEAIRPLVEPSSFQRWIAPLRFLELKNGTVVVNSGNKIVKDWVDRHFRGALQEALQAEMGVEVRLELCAQSASKNGESQPQEKQMSFADLGASPWSEPGLNGSYTFDRFVVGPCNEFAYTASLEVSRSPETRYNPLLLLGDVGLGKSHLSCAIGNHILLNDRRSRVVYITAEGFVNEMVHGLKAKKLEVFKDKFRRQCDVLVVDGVQFLSGKAKTQMELAYTLDALYNTKKRVVLTSNVLPRDISEMEESLRSRLGCGLVVDIMPPDPVTRMRILQQKARQEGVELPEVVTEFLAQRIVGNIRQLESVLIHLVAKASLLRRPLDLDLAKEVTQALLKQTPEVRKPTIEEIQDCVCRYFHIEREVLLSRSRKKSVYYPRQIAMCLCRENTDETLTAIGKAFNRDHASVLHALAVIQQKCQQDPTTRHQVEFLAEQILKIP